MPFVVTMPKLSPTMEEGTVVKWHIREGTFVPAGSVLLEILTDKATVEYEALDSGWLKKILVIEGVSAPVNAPLALFTKEEKESIEGFAVKTEEKKEEVRASTLNIEKSEERGARVPASPLARRLAKERGIDLQAVEGTGPKGRIMSRDLIQGEELSPMRKVIAKRLQEAKATIPHFYVSMDVDVEALVKFRQELKAEGKGITLNDLVLKATALALKEHPGVNSGFDRQSLIRFSTIDISVAVNLPEGLITPIVKNADKKTVSEISLEVKELAEKAKAGKLKPEEFQGGSFTLSNLGMFGVTAFSAIISPPQGAILAVAVARAVPVVKEGKVVPGQVMTLTLSSDHRVIDGVLASQFLVTLKRLLEHPPLILT